MYVLSLIRWDVKYGQLTTNVRRANFVVHICLLSVLTKLMGFIFYIL